MHGAEWVCFVRAGRRQHGWRAAPPRAGPPID